MRWLFCIIYSLLSPASEYFGIGAVREYRVRKQQASTLQLEYRSNDLVSCGPMTGEGQSLYTD